MVSKPMDRLERKVLTRDTLNPNIIKAQYAVRGELAIRAEELKEVPHSWPLQAHTARLTGFTQ